MIAVRSYDIYRYILWVTILCWKHYLSVEVPGQHRDSAAVRE